MEIIRDERFSEKLIQYKDKIHRLDEHIRGLEWILSRKPKEYTLVNKNHDLWAYSFYDALNKQDVKVFYFVKDTIRLIDIHVVSQE